MPIIYEPKGRAREYAPLAANIVRGCNHGCLYCYAPGVLRINKESFHSDASVRKNVFNQLDRDLAKLKGSGKRVLLSFTTDPYQDNFEARAATRTAICKIKDAGLSVEILTKGGTRACCDFDLLDESDCFATTLTFDNDDDSLKWEPCAALPGDRLVAIMQAKRRGIRTWASLEPVIVPDQTLNIIRETWRVVDLYKVGMLNHHKLSKTIDWKEFGKLAVELLEYIGRPYYIKNDLMAKLDAETRAIAEVASSKSMAESENTTNKLHAHLILD